MHIDTSGKSPLALPAQGVYEVWMRLRNQPWKKIAEWLGGKTPHFTWPLLRQAADGSKTFRMPTTVGGVSRDWADYWIYLDDFAVAARETDLPVYEK